MDMGCCYSEFHTLCDRQTTGSDREGREGDTRYSPWVQRSPNILLT